METKVCSMCGIEKELKLFRPDRNKCRKCNTETTRLWRIKNKGSRKKWYYNKHAYYLGGIFEFMVSGCITHYGGSNYYAHFK